MTDLRDTIPVSTSKDAITLPIQCVEAAPRENQALMKKGNTLGEYRLLGLMKVIGRAELWYAQGPCCEPCVAKVIGTPGDDELLAQLQMMNCEHLVHLLDYGCYEGWHYEIYPFYRKGTIKPPQSEEVIRRWILPSLIHALSALHEEGMVHNDIKPENLFWNDTQDSVLLGDFGSICKKGQTPASVTPSYAAPELLLGDVSRRSSDWCSVGLTLAALSRGAPLLNGKSVREAAREWERGIGLTQGSLLFRQLVNGMINLEYRKRLGPKAAKKWCDQEQFGGEGRKSAHTLKEKQPITVSFENPKWIAADIPSLLQGIEDHWEFSSFLFHEGKFDAFLAHFDRNWLDRCKKLRKKNHPEDGLFQLTLELMGNQSFIWRAVRYSDLAALEQEWEKGGESRENVLLFLRRGLVGVCLAHTGADETQLEYVRKLQSLSHYHPDQACNQLFQSLIGDKGYQRGTFRMQSLSDLLDWLLERTETLDQEIGALMRDSDFRVWFSFQGMEGVLEQIERKVGV